MTPKGRQEGLELCALAADVPALSSELSSRLGMLPRTHAVLGFVRRGRDLVHGSFALLDIGLEKEAAILHRSLLETLVRLVWLRKDWQHRYERWFFDSLARLLRPGESIAADDKLVFSRDERSAILDKIAEGHTHLKILVEKGFKRIPTESDLFNAVGATTTYQRDYAVMSSFAHPTYTGVTDHAPPLSWSLAIGSPYLMGATLLLRILIEVDADQDMGWAPALDDLQARLAPS